MQGVARDDFGVVPAEPAELVSGHLCELGGLLEAGDAAVLANGVGPSGDGETYKCANLKDWRGKL